VRSPALRMHPQALVHYAEPYLLLHLRCSLPKGACFGTRPQCQQTLGQRCEGGSWQGREGVLQLLLLLMLVLL
jgi:hypothetical protein